MKLYDKKEKAGHEVKSLFFPQHLFSRIMVSLTSFLDPITQGEDINRLQIWLRGISSLSLVDKCQLTLVDEVI